MVKETASRSIGVTFEEGEEDEASGSRERACAGRWGSGTGSPDMVRRRARRVWARRWRESVAEVLVERSFWAREASRFWRRVS